MILKVYIRRKLFHLPRNQDDLTKMIKEKFYVKRTLVKSALTKLYYISNIESSTINYKNNVNIFLINLYLLVLEHKGELLSDEDISITLSDKNILVELSKILDKDLNALSIEETEKKIEEYISGDNSNDKGSDEESDQKNLEVDFSIRWVKEMDRKIRE